MGIGTNNWFEFEFRIIKKLGIGTKTECEFELQTKKMNDKIVEIVCGSNHSIIQLLNDEVHGFGSNNCGELGTGDKIDVLSPTLLMKDNK